MHGALALIRAEIELARAAFPDAPLHVLKLDLKEFYPSLSHDLLLRMLSRLGLADRDIEFFERYLRVRVDDNGQVLIWHAGVPNHRRVSDLLGELVLLMLDQYVQRRARALIVRVIDDICLLAPSAEEAVKAWEAVHAFCAACGLALNEEKCGAVCIGGALAPALPAAPPCWLLLELNERGEWEVYAAGFEALLGQAREQIAAANSILAKVDLYNAHLAHLERALALTAALGPEHRRSVRAAIQRFQHELFGSQRGIGDELRRAIRERFTGTASHTQLPEAWLYWPITAGGLGLRQAVMRAATYAEGFERLAKVRPPTERTADWQRRDNDWARFYASLLSEVSAVEPAGNQVMETLVNDFISRGAELSSGKQTGLSPYWRWVLYLYGPQILESFGTFRFLFSELVPLQLITERHLEDGEVAVGQAADGAASDLAGDLAF
jgi:hypothetical protein